MHTESDVGELRHLIGNAAQVARSHLDRLTVDRESAAHAREVLALQRIEELLQQALQRLGTG